MLGSSTWHAGVSKGLVLQKLYGTCRENSWPRAISFSAAGRCIPSGHGLPGGGTVFQAPAPPSIGASAFRAGRQRKAKVTLVPEPDGEVHLRRGGPRYQAESGCSQGLPEVL